MSYLGRPGLGTDHGGKTARKADGARTRTVFDNDMVAHVWAQQAQTFGRSGNGNFYFEGPTIFSYGSHFPVATFTGRKVDGRDVVLITTENHSPTTSGHVSRTRRALHGLDVVVVDVPKLAKWLSAARTLADWTDRAASDPADAVAARVLKQSREQIAAAHDTVRASYIDRVGACGVPDSEYLRDAATRHRAAWEAYRKAFGLGVKAKLPRDCARVVTDQTAARKGAADRERVADARTYAKRLDGRNPLASVLRPDYITPPAVESASLYSIDDVLRTHGRIKGAADKARHWLNRGKASTTLKARVGRLLRDLKASTAAFETCKADRIAFERRARLADFVRSVRALIETGAPDSLTCLDARNMIDAASRGLAWRVDEMERVAREVSAFDGDNADVVAWVYQQASIAHAVKEAGSRHIGRTPAWCQPHFVRHKLWTKEEQTTAWLAGETVTNFYSDNPTLVRRRGDVLETSRGAKAPFREAVAVFLKAQECRKRGASWHANGEGMSAGGFDLRSISRDGNIQIGCHVISFAEMLRLACAETPEHVRPRFPVPAVVA